MNLVIFYLYLDIFKLYYLYLYLNEKNYPKIGGFVRGIQNE